MRTLSTLLRAKTIPLLATAAGMTLAVGVMVPSVAGASPVQSKPYFFVWKAGTPLPAVPVGFKLMAWPPQQVLQTLKVGQNVPAVVMTTARAAKMAVTPASYTPLENAAGQVNFEAIPTQTSASPVHDSCVPSLPQYVADEGSHVTSVMQSYSTVGGTNTGQQQKFNYGVGQSSSVEVGSSQSGDSGTYSGGGTAGITDSGHSQQGFATQYGRSFNHFNTYFEWGKYKVYNSCPQLDYYEIMPYQWNAGTNYVHPSGAPGATHCTPEHNGDSFTQSNTTASKFGVAFSVLGFSGSAQTGYSQNASIYFRFAETAQLCGVNNTPPNSPGILVAS